MRNDFLTGLYIFISGCLTMVTWVITLHFTIFKPEDTNMNVRIILVVLSAFFLLHGIIINRTKIE